MKIQIVSDLHAEFQADAGKAFARSLDNTGVDVLVIAGDTGTLRQTRNKIANVTEALSYLCDRFSQVVFVAGNHEYYQARSIREVEDTLGMFTAGHPNLHWLNRTSVTIDGQRFLGGTMWFKDDPLSFGARKNMNDFAVIPGFVPWVFNENQKTVEFLRREMKAGDVVVTHHLPSPQSIDPDYRGSPLNSFYVCDMTKEILAKRPALWAHGHSHCSMDYMLGDTRVIGNPFGYALHGENLNFDCAKIVELG